MPVVVDVVVRRKEETLLGDVCNLDIGLGDRVIIEIDEAFEVGLVTSNERLVEKPKEQPYKIVRKFQAEDARRIEENKGRNEQAMKVVLQKVGEYKLKMKLTCVEYSFDRSKLFIYYTADTRIDFRQLIKDLGHALKTRIQMVQIGVRDEAKMFGGLGHCGRVLCCRTFLKDFTPVTIDMAKNQGLSMNIPKVSGLCGRLMCCLAYEQCVYLELAKKLPRVDSKVNTPDGSGIVVAVNSLKGEITVELQDKHTKKYPADKVTATFLGKIGLK